MPCVHCYASSLVVSPLYAKPQPSPPLPQRCNRLQFLQSLQTSFCSPFSVCSSQNSAMPPSFCVSKWIPPWWWRMWCESSVRGTLISEIHPGGLCPASLVSVQTVNFLAETTRIAAQPFAPSFSSHSITHPLMPRALFITPHYNFFTAHKHSTLCECLHLGRKIISDTHTKKIASFPNLMMNNAAHRYTRAHRLQSPRAHFTECVKQ